MRYRQIFKIATRHKIDMDLLEQEQLYCDDCENLIEHKDDYNLGLDDKTRVLCNDCYEDAYQYAHPLRIWLKAE